MSALAAHSAEGEPQRKKSRSDGGTAHMKRALAQRMAALDEALQAGRPLWSAEHDERDALALVEAEVLLDQVRHVIVRIAVVQSHAHERIAAFADETS